VVSNADASANSNTTAWDTGQGGGPFAARLRQRAFARILPWLGPRWVLVAADGAPVPEGLGTASAAVVAVLVAGVRGAATPPDAASSRGGAPHRVRGASSALPVQSESATGVLVVPADIESALGTVAEAARLLQPGGVAAFVTTCAAESVRSFDPAFADAALEAFRRFAIRRTGAAPAGPFGRFAWAEERRASRAEPGERVECAVLARRRGTDLPLPTTRSLLAEMFVPRFLRR
jgi:hypothetical protein